MDVSKERHNCMRTEEILHDMEDPKHFLEKKETFDEKTKNKNENRNE